MYLYIYFVDNEISTQTDITITIECAAIFDMETSQKTNLNVKTFVVEIKYYFQAC